MSPYNAELPQSCYVFIHASPGDRVGLVVYGCKGILVTKIDQKDLSDAQANVLVNALNSARGINPETAKLMLDQAISGWCAANTDERLAA